MKTKELVNGGDPILPQGWAKWLKANGFKMYSGDPYSWQGYGRHWRITCYGEMEASDCYHAFDRWANSTFYTTDNVPQTEEEFTARVSFMLKRIARKERYIKYLIGTNK